MSNDASNHFYSPEKIAAIRKIRKLMDFWRITPNEIRVAPKVERQEPVSAPARYQHPITGASWDGLGKQPDWLRQALTKEGYTVEELRRAVGQPPGGLSMETETDSAQVENL
ncbi:MAG: H-NS family nucleoid-associated regulatory protein [Leptothrix sp. (in: b-proteobacteria)]|jgi:DNA-binding protein H-NS